MNLNCMVNVIKEIVFNLKVKIRMITDSGFIILTLI